MSNEPAPSSPEDVGYVGPRPLRCPTPQKLPCLTVDQLRTLRRVHAGRVLDRKVWTLLCMGELARYKLIAPSSPANERWIVTPLGVEILELAKGRR